MLIKRIFDFLFSLLAIIVLMPVFVLIAILILIDSRGGALYLQERVGRGNKNFKLIKFRTMKTGADKLGLLTIGNKDLRITRVGKFLRKSKLDELPQLINVFVGDMSFVGPRPEVRKYVSMYNQQQQQVLHFKPGITDPASIQYRNENQILTQYTDPEKAYIEKIMPDKLKINLDYQLHRTFISDMGIIIKTIYYIFN